MTAANVPQQAQQAGRQAHNSEWVDRAARIGLVAYAIVYVLLGWLAIQLALGHSSGKPSSTGAMRELTQQPLGGVLIWVVALGMFLLVIWQLLEAAYGHRDDDGTSRTGKRLMSVGKAILYGAVGVSGLKVATGSGGGGGSKSQESTTAKLMDLPGGQLIVGVVALAILAYGAYQIYVGWSEKHAEKLDAEGRSGDSGTAYLAFGKVGYTAKGLVIVIVGLLFGYAAVTHDAKKSGGVDQALFKVLDQPFGPVLLCAMGVGLICYGLFTLARARHLAR